MFCAMAKKMRLLKHSLSQVILIRVRMCRALARIVKGIVLS